MYINKKKVTNWLAQHNFPLGMVYFSDGLSRDPLRQKTETLRNLVLNNSLKLTGAYGSAKDVPMYASLGLPASRIFMIGRVKTKYLSQAVALKDGYASHLTMLQNPNSGFRHASGNARLILKKTTFTVRQSALFTNFSAYSSSLLNSNILNNNTNNSKSSFSLAAAGNLNATTPATLHGSNPNNNNSVLSV